MEDLEPQYDLSEVGFPISEPVPYFALIVREPNKIRLVNVGPEVVRCVQEKLQQLVKVETSGYVIFKVGHGQLLSLMSCHVLVLKQVLTANP